jgi:ABC-type nitrate/sulfonate/bicarbonate transport system permease component
MKKQVRSSILLLSRYWPILFVIGGWQLLASAKLYNTTLLPAPSEVIVAWCRLLLAGDLLKATLGSLQRVLVGFGIAVVVAFLLALLVSRFKLIESNVKLIVEFLRPISPIAWIPLGILWFKTGDGPAYFIVFIASFFPIFLNLLLGIHSVSEKHLDVARSFRASRWLTITDVLWPAAKPSIITGLRLGLGYAWMSLIAAELIAVRLGLGYLIQINRVALNMENVVAVMGTIGLVGLLMNFVIQLYAKVTMPWWPASNSFTNG